MKSGQKFILSLNVAIASLCFSSAAFAGQQVAANTPPATMIMTPAQLADEVADQGHNFGGVFLLSRSSSLYDHKDGTRKDGIDYAVLPSLKTSFGSFSSKIVYSQDLRDETGESSDWADVPLTFAFKPWKKSAGYSLVLTPTITAVIPTSKNSSVRDQLQTAVITGLSLGYSSDEALAPRGGVFMASFGLTAGRSFHTYEEDINGKVLNKYSSNQTLNLGYTYKVFSVSFEFIHKTRLTYQNSTKDSFEHTEEIGYSITDSLSVAVGHTNAGAGLRANGVDSNVDLINENDSQIYGQVGFTF